MGMKHVGVGIGLAATLVAGVSGAAETRVMVRARTKDAKFIGTSMGGALVAGGSARGLLHRLAAADQLAAADLRDLDFVAAQVAPVLLADFLHTHVDLLSGLPILISGDIPDSLP